MKTATLRHPAEWENQKAVWFTWPHNENEWGPRMEGIRRYYLKLIALILQYQITVILIGYQDTQLACLFRSFNFIMFDDTRLEYNN